MLTKYISSIGLVARDKEPLPTLRSDSVGMGEPAGIERFRGGIFEYRKTKAPVKRTPPSTEKPLATKRRDL